MTPERQIQIERICQTALECKGGERAAFLADACAGDDALRQAVVSLLAREHSAEQFIETPALDVAAHALAATPSLDRHIEGYELLSLLGAGGDSVGGCHGIWWPVPPPAVTADESARHDKAMMSNVGTPVGVLVILVGASVALSVLLTRSVRAERALRESEARVRLVADRAPVMIWTARPDTTLDFLNHTCVDFTGRPLAQLLNEGWLDCVHPEDLDRCRQTYEPAFEARQPFLMEYRVRHADGSYRWLLATGVPKYDADGSFAGYIGCDVDVTERRNAEDRIHDSHVALEQSHRETQHLAGRLIEAQDTERARIARDLHDDVSQQLAGVSIAFSGLKQRLGDYGVSEELQQELVDLQQQTLTLARNVRQLSHDLHPTVLRHLGLEKALASYCGELERSHGVVMGCSADGDFASIGPEAALCLYRIAQEALRNVVTHSGAGRANVRLCRRDDDAEITITDDGRGFNLTDPDIHQGLGLVSISERAKLTGGTISIETGLNRGTRVHATIPVGRPSKTSGSAVVEGPVA
jgi:PAS domain S-box-containing protein